VKCAVVILLKDRNTQLHESILYEYLFINV